MISFGPGKGSPSSGKPPQPALHETPFPLNRFIPEEGREAFRRSRECGMSFLRACAVGLIGCYKDCWMFRARIARELKISVRTVQRAITQAKKLGLIVVARGGKEEVPPHAKKAIPCGWSHRWTVGWRKPRVEAWRKVEQRRMVVQARWVVQQAAEAVQAPATKAKAAEARESAARRRKWTPEELDAELARVPAVLAVDPPKRPPPD